MDQLLHCTIALRPCTPPLVAFPFMLDLTCLEALRKSIVQGSSSDTTIIDGVNDALQQKGSPNAQDSRGWSPLMAAALLDDVDSAKVLVESGADIYAENANGFTARMWATHANSTKVAAFLASQVCPCS